MIAIMVGIIILGICNGGQYEDKFLQTMSTILFFGYILVKILSIFY